MNDITFTGIMNWFVGIFFFLVVLIIGSLLALEMVWRHLAQKSKKKLLKKWADKYEKNS